MNLQSNSLSLAPSRETLSQGIGGPSTLLLCPWNPKAPLKQSPQWNYPSLLSLNFPPIPPPSSVSWLHTNYQHTLFHLIIIQTKRPVLKETSGGEEKTRGWEVTEPPCVITNKDLIKLNSMPRKTAKGSQLLVKANKCLFKMNAHECRQNWTSIIINLHRRCKDHSKGNGQQFF